MSGVTDKGLIENIYHDRHSPIFLKLDLASGAEFSCGCRFLKHAVMQGPQSIGYHARKCIDMSNSVQSAWCMYLYRASSSMYRILSVPAHTGGNACAD